MGLITVSYYKASFPFISSKKIFENVEAGRNDLGFLAEATEKEKVPVLLETVFS